LLAVKNPHAQVFYETEALRGGWTSRQLDRQIQSQFYERTALSRDKAAMLRKGAEPATEDISVPEREIKDRLARDEHQGARLRRLVTRGAPGRSRPVFQARRLEGRRSLNARGPGFRRAVPSRFDEHDLSDHQGRAEGGEVRQRYERRPTDGEFPVKDGEIRPIAEFLEVVS
jgi:hypothetical protein